MKSPENMLVATRRFRKTPSRCCTSEQKEYQDAKKAVIICDKLLKEAK